VPLDGCIFDSVGHMHLDSNSAVLQAVTVAIRAIVERPAFAHARFGLAVHDVERGRAIYEHHAHDIFAGASTTKIPTVTFALALLGPDFRFRTRLVRSGYLDGAGTLYGDLVLLASGDPNLSGRVTPDGQLDFQNVDHSIGWPKARLVERNPLQVIDALAVGVRDAGVRRVTGTLLVDTHLFPEGYREPGTETIVSPIAVNDNLIDITVTAGRCAGERLSYEIRPRSGYVRFIDLATTGEIGSDPTLSFSSERRELDGTWSVEIRGTVPAGTTYLARFAVESPLRFARTLLIEALAANGIVVEGAIFGVGRAMEAVSADAKVLSEHVSPPLKDVVKVVMKVSQNLHAEMLIPVIGATLRGVHGAGAVAAGYACGAELLASWGLDMTGACQGDAAGSCGFFSPDFMCRLLLRIASSDIAGPFMASLPVMGRDGTLWDIQSTSPAAGHVRAKTGTLTYDDRLHKGRMFSAKGLAGYIDAKSGRRFAFTAYLANFHQSASSDVDPGQVLGELAAVIYEYL
jgi:PBP4 family serine-type D-alanyl-D-alanine carboxypeptidase